MNFQLHMYNEEASEFVQMAKSKCRKGAEFLKQTFFEYVIYKNKRIYPTLSKLLVLCKILPFYVAYEYFCQTTFLKLTIVKSKN